jgi:Ricin-type beta-trefoil lectin domain
MQAHRCRSSFSLLAALALLCGAGAAHAGEIVDGNNPPTVRNNMHVCPPGYITTGVQVSNNQLLCLGLFTSTAGFLTTGETVVSGSFWPPDTVTRAAYAFTGTSIPWCGPDRYVTGVHVANRQLSCAQFPWEMRNATRRLGHLVVDGASSATVRNNMHACPRGTILVGANFDNNTFLCAGLPFCSEDAHCTGAGDVCEFQSAACGDSCLSSNAGVCRQRGMLTFKEDSGCRGDVEGWVTDRSGNMADFNADGFDDNDAESLHLGSVRAGTIIRVYDDEGGSQSDDWAQILVKSTTTTCLGGFETSFESAALKVDFHPVSDLDDEVSRVDVRSALIDFAGRCADVNTNNNAAQIFTCHGGPNQSWIHEVDGEIRGWNNLCLEANSAEIHTWPNLAAGQVRRAAVRVAACNGSVFQKWTATDAGQIRMFADMCLDIVGGSSQNNAALQIYPCHGGQNQRWLSSF